MFKGHNQTNIVPIISAFAIGSLIGAGMALLVAPRSGEETRAMIKNRGQEVADRAADTAESTRRRAEKAMDDLADRTKRETEELRQRGHDVMDASRKKF
jgi:gas vesicle protein